jgi:hypothetical protein
VRVGVVRGGCVVGRGVWAVSAVMQALVIFAVGAALIFARWDGGSDG